MLRRHKCEFTDIDKPCQSCSDRGFKCGADDKILNKDMPLHLESHVRTSALPMGSQIPVIEKELAPPRPKILPQITEEERQSEVPDHVYPPVSSLGEYETPRAVGPPVSIRSDSEGGNSQGEDNSAMVLTPPASSVLGGIDNSLLKKPADSTHPEQLGGTSIKGPLPSDDARTRPQAQATSNTEASANIIHKTTKRVQPAPSTEKPLSTIPERGMVDAACFKTCIPARRVVDLAKLARFHMRTPLRPYLYQVQKNPFKYWIERRYGLSIESEPLYLAAKLFGSDQGTRRSSMADYLRTISEENGSYPSIDLVYSSYTVAPHCLEASTPYPFGEMNIHAIKFAENLQCINPISSLERSEIDLLKILGIELLWMVSIHLTRFRESRLWLGFCNQATECIPPILGFMVVRLDSDSPEGLTLSDAQWREQEITFTALQTMLDLQFYHWASLLEDTADSETRVRKDSKVDKTLSYLFEECLLSIPRIPQLHDIFKSIFSDGDRPGQIIAYSLREETPCPERIMLYFSILILKTMIFEDSHSEALFAAKVILSLVIGQPWGKVSYYRTSYRRWCALQSLLLAAITFHALGEDDCLIH
jgi:hypothetical protein